ncbi:MAG TPA: SIMPL domain-containing protein [Longilinea sp.]|nr:SIMPL domain-containing protein [Longilinea sp.]
MKTKFGLVTISIMVMAVILAGCGSSTSASVTNSIANTPSISVTGTGEIYLAPDVAYINIGVQTEAPTVTEAVAQNTDQAQAIRDALTQFGVEDADIQTSGFSVYPMPQYGPDGLIMTTLYQVNNTVYVTIRDLSGLGDVLDAVVQSGANTINSIAFDVLDQSDALAQARLLAIQDAHDQAAQMAEAAGVSLGDPLTISVYTTSAPSSIYEARGGVSYDATSSSVPIAAGQLVVSVQVSVSYELR